MDTLIMMMAVVVLGGLGSIKGSFIAAYILGFTEALVVFMIPKGAFLKGSVALTIMVLVLASRVIVALFFVLLLGMPLISQNTYLIRVIVLTSIFAILAASWDLLSGFTGQMNFGHALFFGVGAYTSAMLNVHLQIPPWGSVPLGALAAALTALLVGR